MTSGIAVPWPIVTFVYVWGDGVHFNIRLEDDRLVALVVVGARTWRDEGGDRDRGWLSQEYE
jgi:hypothetical protein